MKGAVTIEGELWARILYAAMQEAASGLFSQQPVCKAREVERH